MGLVYPQLITGADLLRGIIKLNHIAPLLKRRGAIAAAIVNSKLYGVPSFYKVMKKYGIHPVMGLSVQVELNENQSVLIYLYAKDDQGYRNLLKISSAVSIREQETLPLQWLEAYREGCLIVCPLTDSSWDENRDETSIQQLMGNQKNSLFIGISRAGGHQHLEEKEIIHIAQKVKCQITAVHESRFIQKEDAFAYEVAEAIRLGFHLQDKPQQQVDFQNAFVPDQAQLEEWFQDQPDWLMNTENMLLSCRAEMPPTTRLMPVFPLPKGEETKVVLMTNCLRGLQQRIGSVSTEYRERLHYELEIIDNMGFSDYFLIVEDFIKYARENGVLTGPGRGSSAGSLVAYALSITDVDPIRYGLIFERFLNPSRVTMPDIDIDFADHRREEVIEYVADKYGKNYVAQIITFGTLSARAVARNVARVFGFSNEEMSFITNEIPKRSGVTIGEAIKESKRLSDWVEMDEIRGKWLNAAQILEGLPRNASTHAAGVILSPIPLIETVPVQSSGEGIYLTQWAMGDVEEQGLLKMDFLGLRNLTLLDRIRSMIQFGKGINIDFDQIPLDDVNTYKLFKNGDMTGIFQFESAGMRESLQLIQPTRFEDVFAITALYRPGPMENIPLYARRKNNNEPVPYLHPQLESILKETYGVIVYQEQIMQIAVDVAGYTMGEADLLRRAISKKNRDILHQERLHFTDSAMRNGLSKQTSNDIYDLIVKFADYGFPKSHAVAYSLISYRLAYLKANEPAYFYAALLTSVSGNHEKIVEIFREINAKGIKVLPPSVQKSKYTYTVENGAIRIGLSSIRGVNLSFYEALKTARLNSNSWQTLFDFAVALGAENFSEKVITSLIKAGALDEFNESRAVLMASIDAAISHALFIRPGDRHDLLSGEMASIARPKYSPAGVIPRMLQLEYEREVLGIYLSEHPAVEIKKTLTEEQIIDIIQINEMRERETVKIVGLVTEIKRIRTKKGDAMAFVTVQDESGSVSCTFFPIDYGKFNKYLIEMKICIFEGKVDRRRGNLQLIIEQVSDI